MKINIHIKSYYVAYLNDFIAKLNLYLKKDFMVFNNLLKIKMQIFLPSKVENYTILRSPHADKKARDQFERKTHKRLISLKLKGITSSNLFFLNKFFQ